MHKFLQGIKVDQVVIFGLVKLPWVIEMVYQFQIYGNKASASWIQRKPEELRLNQVDGTIKIIDRSNSTIVASKKRYNRMTPGTLLVSLKHSQIYIGICMKK